MIFQNQLIESLAANSSRTAIECSNRSLSYSLLLKKANDVTQSLLSETKGEGRRVGVMLEDRIDIIISMIGIMNARCVFVPLNADLPSARIQNMLSELNLDAVITDGPANIDFGNTEIMNFSDLIKVEDTGAINYPDFNAEDALYIYFTSGSTGKPKGIVGKNTSLLQYINWQIKEFEIKHTFRVSQLISPYFDAFLRDIFVPLLAGGTVCIPPVSKELFTSENLIKWINNSQVNLIHCVPSMFQQINQENLSSKCFQMLKYVLMSGEKIVPKSLTNWFDKKGDQVQLVNLYGTTETTMIRSFYRIKSTDSKLPNIPIGKPIADTEILVAKADLKPCNKLMQGDVYIVSKYVTHGYLNQPELTKEKFLNYQSDSLGDVVAYKTGDKGRILASGQVELLGRDDRQLKLNGIRIELDEIENTIQSLKEVKQAVVLNKKSVESNFLVAFALLENNVINNEQLLKTVENHISNQLPAYMHPSKIVLLNEFPLLPNGKTDQKALLLNLETKNVIKPANEIEETVLGIWKDILGDKEISVTDSFQLMGGNSLSILKLISKIYSTYHVRITLSDLFKNLTIQLQAGLIGQLTEDDCLEIKKASEKESYVLSSAQERLYYHYELDKESLAFNMPMAWKIEGELDFEALQNAFTSLIERHEAFRTSFINEGGRVKQTISNQSEIIIEKVLANNASFKQAVADLVKPFNLKNDQLIRGYIVTNEQDENLLLVDMHHIISDGISQSILFTEFLKLYNKETLTALPLQYKDYAEWEEGFKVTSDYLSHREFWLKSFEKEYKGIQFPVSVTKQEANTLKGGNVNFSIEKSKVNQVLESISKDQITLFSGLYTVYYLFLMKLTGQSDLVIGINTSGRIQDNLESVVGMFVKTLPVRYSMKGNDFTFSTLAKEIHEQLVKVNSNQIYDLSNITNDLNKGRSESVKDLISTMFVFQNFQVEEVDTGKTQFNLFNFDKKTSKFPLSLFADETNDSFTFRFEYSDEYFTAKDMEFLVSEYKSLIETINVNLKENVMNYLLTDTSEEVEQEIEFNF